MGDRVTLGTVGSTKGLRGEFRVNPFSGEPDGIKQLTMLGLADGSYRKVLSVGVHKKQAVVKLEGITSIEQAQALAGQEVWVDSDDLPATDEDAFYWFDLVGSLAFDPAGARIGEVSAIESTGAHDTLVIKLEGGREARVPFVDEFVVEVDSKGKRLVLDPPPGLLDL